MRVLLDTHAFLWWVRDDGRLSGRARDALSDVGNELLFSVVSGWEIAIKAQLGKLRASEDVGAYLSGQLSINSMQVLPIYLSHAVRVADLPNHHRDPFDRLLVAQALVEDLPLVSVDPEISRYPVEVIW